MPWPNASTRNGRALVRKTRHPLCTDAVTVDGGGLDSDAVGCYGCGNPNPVPTKDAFIGVLLGEIDGLNQR